MALGGMQSSGWGHYVHGVLFSRGLGLSWVTSYPGYQLPPGLGRPTSFMLNPQLLEGSHDSPRFQPSSGMGPGLADLRGGSQRVVRERRGLIYGQVCPGPRHLPRKGHTG